jgi:hypothetical protein
VVRAAVAGQLTALADDDSRSVAAAATALLDRLAPAAPVVDVPAPRTAPALLPVAPPVPPVRATPHVVSPRVELRPPDEPLLAGPPEPPAAVAPEPPEPPAALAPEPPRAVRRWEVPAVVLALVVAAAVPLLLSRLLAFESSVPYTADEFSESTAQWSLVVVVPLVVAVGLLAARSRLPGLLPVALGLVAGVGLALVENAVFWIFWFVENADGYDAGPATVVLIVGTLVVTAAGVLGATRGPLAGRPNLRADWRVACAVVVVAAALVSLVYGPETFTVPAWISASVGTLLLAAVALPLTLVRLRADQRVAALVAVTVFGVWLVFFPVRELLTDSPVLGLEDSVWVARVVGVVLTLLACVAAQAGRAAATSPDPR